MDDTDDGAYLDADADTSAAADPSGEEVPRSRRAVRVLGKVGFWTVGTILGWYAGFFAWLTAFHVIRGGCMYGACMEQSWPRGIGLALLSGVTLTVWLLWAAWATEREMPRHVAMIGGAVMASLPVLWGLFVF